MLLASNVLLVDQVTVFMTTDFAIRDGNGQVVGQIRTEGGLGKRMLMGNREFTVFDGEQPSFIIHDVVNFGRDRFEILTPDRQVLATVVKNITLFKRKLSITVWDGTELTVQGSWLDFHYEIDGPGGRLANVDRSWPGIGAALLGRDRYVIAFADQAPPVLRQVVIGAAITIDRIRAKESNSSSVSFST